MVKRYTPNKLRGGVILTFVVAAALSSHALTPSAKVAWVCFDILLGLWLLRGAIRWAGKTLWMLPVKPKR